MAWTRGQGNINGKIGPVQAVLDSETAGCDGPILLFLLCHRESLPSWRTHILWESSLCSFAESWEYLPVAEKVFKTRKTLFFLEISSSHVKDLLLPTLHFLMMLRHTWKQNVCRYVHAHVCVCKNVCVAIKGARSILQGLQIIKLLFFWLHYASWGLSVGILPASTQGHNAEDLTHLYVRLERSIGYKTQKKKTA